jgi:hypothetical protein
MSDLTRRDALAGAAAAGVVALLGPVADARAAKDKKTEQALKAERQHVIACGFTEAEADCWELTAQAAGKFFKLPKLHPMDQHEVAQAIHIIQNKLLGRPAYRRYLKLARKGKTE